MEEYLEFYIARQPVFNRGVEVFGYKLYLCRNLKEHYYAQYGEPDDAEELYRQLCFADLEESPEQPAAVIEYSEELFEHLIPLLPREHVIVEYDSSDNSEQTDLGNLMRVKAHGYRVAYDATRNTSRKLIEFSDIVRVDFSAVSMESQTELIQKYKGRTSFLVYNIQTWEDFKKAFSIGYTYFQGNFFMKPFAVKMNGIRSFNINILRVISELAKEEPSFKELTNIIEHDLNLSYRLLKLVNSAYIAPKFKVKTISQAVTILGLLELNKFMTTMLMKETQTPGNTELLRRSLIRGKLMELLADDKKIPQKGSEAFFTGIFSLIDVILNKNMEDIMEELPLTDDVKAALTGEDNNLKALLTMVTDYETADWAFFSSRYKPNLVEQKKLMSFYISALAWAESLDF